ncbi:MAG: MerR family transcriptional regulator [Chloroflexi bacterium]|nr:MerR family transcriptional regulator [Chloroflexota bacterium]MDA1003480.1 MerR family transcriptional regulator [Chloroflexota bacterium]
MALALRSDLAPTAPPEIAHRAGLRTRLVTRLTGLSQSQLRYWHESGLLDASLRPGRRGIPRLYSWIDYVRIQLASELKVVGTPTPRIRRAVDFLDARLPDWYLLPIHLRYDESHHIRARASGLAPFLADAAGQFALDWPREVQQDAANAERALKDLARRGPLCALSGFDDAVFMDPIVNLAQPSLVGTALETRFLARMATEIGVGETAVLYRLDRSLLTRAIEFEGAVA